MITEVKLDFEDDTNVKYLSSINPFPLGSKPLQPAPGIYNSAQACKSNSEGNGSSKSVSYTHLTLPTNREV